MTHIRTRPASIRDRAWLDYLRKRDEEDYEKASTQRERYMNTHRRANGNAAKALGRPAPEQRLQETWHQAPGAA